ncbi:hypothetical protein WJX79_005087 [Trebouxia sp. C0005]
METSKGELDVPLLIRIPDGLPFRNQVADIAGCSSSKRSRSRQAQTAYVVAVSDISSYDSELVRSAENAGFLRTVRIKNRNVHSVERVGFGSRSDFAAGWVKRTGCSWCAEAGGYGSPSVYGYGYGYSSPAATPLFGSPASAPAYSSPSPALYYSSPTPYAYSYYSPSPVLASPTPAAPSPTLFGSVSAPAAYSPVPASPAPYASPKPYSPSPYSSSPAPYAAASPVSSPAATPTLFGMAPASPSPAAYGNAGYYGR